VLEGAVSAIRIKGPGGLAVSQGLVPIPRPLYSDLEGSALGIHFLDDMKIMRTVVLFAILAADLISADSKSVFSRSERCRRPQSLCGARIWSVWESDCPRCPTLNCGSRIPVRFRQPQAGRYRNLAPMRFYAIPISALSRPAVDVHPLQTRNTPHSGSCPLHQFHLLSDVTDFDYAW